MKTLNAYFYMSLCATAFTVHASDAHTVISKLKHHYAFAQNLDKLAISYTSQSETRFQSNDFRTPFTIHSRYDMQLDTTKQQFFFHDQHVFPGNYIFDEKIVHQQGETILYDVNGFTKGKQLRFIEYSLQDLKEDMSIEIDFLAAYAFLHDGTEKTAQFNHANNWVELTQRDDEEEQITYRFTLNPINLSSISYKNSASSTVFSTPQHSHNFTYASAVQHFNNTTLQETVHVTRVAPITHIPPELLEVPQGYGPFIDDQEKNLQWVQIAPKIYLINYVAGNRHVLVQENPEGLTVFGAPSSRDVSEQVIALIQKKLPQKPISQVYITHGHSDHMGGLAAYGERGITLVVDSHSIAAIKAYQKFSQYAANWRFKTLTHGQTLNGVKYYLPENSHAHGQSFAYFIDSQIIYQGDFLEIPFDNTLPTHMADVEKEFIEFLKSEKIVYNRIVAHHRNNNISPEVVDAYYQAHHGKVTKNKSITR
ncbi:MBL fold metallo-hydrolase [Pseudoalteromonas citrea]|uniref:MBL fold metallo-hydrolase n=1 Tax=Pseudoalteromonas citrea TaxID=43655 RepID=UPI0014864CCE|nr:MBL fold metallo-hydrolase [Pseudoalteromonas citrea]